MSFGYNAGNQSAKLAKSKSDALGSAKTHELVLIPHVGPLLPAAAARQAHAACQPPLLQADPAVLCRSGALPWPLHPKDEKRFPAEETLVSDFFDRTVLPNEFFPKTGLIEWGSCPYLDYHKQDARKAANPTQP